MKKLELRELRVGDEAAFLDGFREWEGEDPTWYSFDYRPDMMFVDLLERLRKNSLGIELQAGHVPSTIFYGFLESKIVGRVDVRHVLNENLRIRGGHFGYAVAPRFRKQGLASEMVRQALPLCRGLGIKSALVTCSEDNVPSWRIIESIGGILEGRATDATDGTHFRKYWVHIV